MKNDYLWDRSGAPDPEVQRLEQLLRAFRSQRPVPLPAAPPRRRWAMLAAAAALAGIGIWLTSGVPQAGWRIARAGTPVGHLAVGETLETGATGNITLDVSGLGRIEVDANSRLRLERAGAREQRMALDHGSIRALIWAPPRTFVVDTPSAVATDLGCYYTMQVDPDGSGLVNVLAGWVSFASQGKESFIPAGASCRTRSGVGPGTPYRDQASPALRQALADFDFAQGGLDTVLAEATKDDAFTLWHLLSRCPPAQAASVYDALAKLAPPPAGVTRDGILRRDRKQLDRWWDQLGFGYANWWRHLESRQPR